MPLSNRELAEYTNGFSSYRSKAFTLPSTNLVNVLTPLAHFATDRIVKMVN